MRLVIYDFGASTEPDLRNVVVTKTLLWDVYPSTVATGSATGSGNTMIHSVKEILTQLKQICDARRCPKSFKLICAEIEHLRDAELRWDDIKECISYTREEDYAGVERQRHVDFRIGELLKRKQVECASCKTTSTGVNFQYVVLINCGTDTSVAAKSCWMCQSATIGALWRNLIKSPAA